MSQNKEYTSQKHQISRQVIAISALVMITLCACNITTILPATSPPQLPEPSPPPTPTISSSPSLTIWNKVRSPLFPSNWAPTAETVWVRYTFAYGSNPAELMDGSYVTNPLSKTECRGDIAEIVVLSNEMVQAAIQGVMPLDEPTRLLLQNEKPVTEDCVKMTELPDPILPETKELIAYYRAWFKYNGAFLDLIREDHSDFIDWVMSND